MKRAMESDDLDPPVDEVAEDDPPIEGPDDEGDPSLDDPPQGSSGPELDVSALWSFSTERGRKKKCL